ncbi:MULTISPECIES: 23S rRNA (guanosine(2251)-2'-O)-methyltransferase RlmB [Candidatus Ichthyocystis]|uniref:23S rRNA (guanosine(2251)-2'-O)-methyltransferase RlmB n=2 Tax=Burkholderiales genera incertae sedis TaxID=224471 RepID=UPI000AD37744|nr:MULTISPECIES: 23S rRNA (guanosine(2251)-2'-O)-methyltransferase RlmB [Ichthyocystis]
MVRFLMGFHVTNMLLDRDPDRIQRAYFLSSRSDPRMHGVLKKLEHNRIPRVGCDGAYLSKLVADSNHQGIVLEVLPLPPYDLDDVLANSTRPLLLVLDGVTDPHNLGSCLRVADATGVTAVIVPKNKSSGLTSVAVKSSSGASEFIKLIHVTNLARTIKMMREDFDIDVVGTSDDVGSDLWEWHPENLTSGVAVVLGSEGRGMRRLTREGCSRMVRIPMHGFVSSLNVSVASGVILYYVQQCLASK